MATNQLDLRPAWAPDLSGPPLKKEAKIKSLPLTGIRFFLALLVVLFHQAGPGTYLNAIRARIPTILDNIIRTGYLAVGVFFVLSGFVLAYNYPLNRSWSKPEWIRFGIARFSRIYPVYCVGLILISPFVGLPLLKHLATVNVGKEIGIILLNAGLLQAWIPATALYWNGPGWSLSNEAFFYLCFPLAGFALWRLADMRHLMGATTLLWVLAVAPAIVAVALPLAGFGDVPANGGHATADPFWTTLLEFNPLLRFPEFCIGIATARAYRTLAKRAGGWWVGRGHYLYLPAILVEVIVISFAGTIPFPLIHNGLLTPLHALAILGMALEGGWLARILSGEPFQFLGGASYSMYILAHPIACWTTVFFTKFSPRAANGPLELLVNISAVIGLASLLFKTIEEPANRLLKKGLAVRLIPAGNR